jgi:hypothetical protein
MLASASAVPYFAMMRLPTQWGLPLECQVPQLVKAYECFFQVIRDQRPQDPLTSFCLATLGFACYGTGARAWPRALTETVKQDLEQNWTDETPLIFEVLLLKHCNAGLGSP